MHATLISYTMKDMRIEMRSRQLSWSKVWLYMCRYRAGMQHLQVNRPRAPKLDCFATCVDEKINGDIAFEVLLLS